MHRTLNIGTRVCGRPSPEDDAMEKRRASTRGDLRRIEDRVVLLNNDDKVHQKMRVMMPWRKEARAPGINKGRFEEDRGVVVHADDGDVNNALNIGTHVGRAHASYLSQAQVRSSS